MSENIIALGADHGGFILKQTIKNYLDSENIKYIDFGTNSQESVDYPIYAKKVSESIISNKANMGILCCGTGIGMSIASNKFFGIRAAVCTSSFCAQMSRRHNDANILCLGGRISSAEDAINFTKIFISTTFDGNRHEKRLSQINQIELKNGLK